MLFIVDQLDFIGLFLIWFTFPIRHANSGILPNRTDYRMIQ